MKEYSHKSKKLTAEYHELYILLPDEEFDAIQYIVPMTDKLYKSIISHCCQYRFYTAMCDFMLNYSDFTDKHVRERESVISQIKIPEDTPEHVQLFISNLKARLKEENLI